MSVSHLAVHLPQEIFGEKSAKLFSGRAAFDADTVPLFQTSLVVFAVVLVLVGGVEYSNRQHEKNVEIDAEPEREVFKRRYDEYYGIVGAFDKFDKQEKIKEEQRYGTPEDRK